MTKITFWSAGENDGCTFYRCQEPARVLAARGHKTLSAKLVGLGTLMSSDVVVVARATEAETLGHVEKLKALPEAHRPRIVYELDDDMFSIPSHFPPGIRGPLHDPARRHRILRFIAAADRVTVTNDYLRARVFEELEGHGYPAPADVRVVPNWVPARLVRDTLPDRPDDYDPFSGFYRYAVGWQGSATHKADFERCVIPLRRLLRDRADTMVAIFGPDYARRLRTAAREETQVYHEPWVDGVEAAVRALDALDLGLAPLEANTFNLSKSDLKLKEYAARGVACIATDFGPYRAGSPLQVAPGIRVDETMFPENVTEVWTAAMSFTLDSPETLANARQYALAWAKANTLENHAEQWEDALLS
jgi:glycosyltransferase involved in cell wall biosynthesis